MCTVGNIKRQEHYRAWPEHPFYRTERFAEDDGSDYEYRGKQQSEYGKGKRPSPEGRFHSGIRA